MHRLTAARQKLAGFFLCLILSLACLGCFGQSEVILNTFPVGVRIVSLTDSSILIGNTTTMTVQYFATTSQEVGQTVDASVYFTRSGVNETIATRRVTLGAVDDPVTVQFTIAFPQGITVGDYTVFATRQAGSVNATIVPDQRTINIFANTGGVTTSFNPAAVSGAKGTTVQSVLTITPVNGLTGTVTLAGRIPEVTVNPPSVTFTAGNQAPQQVTVSYAIPANALGDGTAVVIDYLVPNRPIASTSIFVAYTTAAPTFTLSVTPALVHVSGQQVQDTVTVTVTSQNGWRGNVSVAFALPGQGALTVGNPNTNPFTIVVDSDAPRTQMVTLRYHAGHGAPIGQATVTATSGATTHTANFNVTAS